MELAHLKTLDVMQITEDLTQDGNMFFFHQLSACSTNFLVQFSVNRDRMLSSLQQIKIMV
ncbi:hypothetical protein HanIR_Chr17g0871481 [Helianthus annuus]|nr:hypothetical protein HanIR_Chr17g0871481 [Helianthus annuus]